MPLHLFNPPERVGDTPAALAALVDDIELAGEHITSSAWVGDSLALFTDDSPGIKAAGS